MSSVVHQFTWRDVEQAACAIETSVREMSFDAIVGISRSGLIPAVILSHRLGVRDFSVIDVHRTVTDDVDARKQPVYIGEWLNDRLLKDRRVLLVDDIVGEGETMLAVKRIAGGYASEVTSAALVVNQANLRHRTPDQVVDYYGCLLWGWVIFPWEPRQALPSEIPGA